MMNAAKNGSLINIIAQAFYGNGTGTSIRRDEAAQFLSGYMDSALFERSKEKQDIRMVKVPGAEHIVIVYDQNQEDEYINVSFPERCRLYGAGYLKQWGEELKPHVTCEIPEIDFKIHTRCFACRIDEAGSLQSLEDEDLSKFMPYFGFTARS